MKKKELGNNNDSAVLDLTSFSALEKASSSSSLFADGFKSPSLHDRSNRLLNVANENATFGSEIFINKGFVKKQIVRAQIRSRN